LLRLDNATAVDEFMHSKFTNVDLHKWMAAQIADVHFNTYGLALDMARRAELAFRHELGIADGSAPFVQPDHWDNLKRGFAGGRAAASRPEADGECVFGAQYPGI
jgi:hypothetical protein